MRRFFLAAGFSLIELLILCLIVGILSVFVATEFYVSTTNTKLGAAAAKLRTDIIYAQSLSFSQQVNHGVIFTPPSTYSVYRQTISNIVPNPLSGDVYTVNYATDSTFNGITFSLPSFGSRLEFDERGIPYSDGGVTPLVSDGTITLSNGIANVTVTVTKNTGKVS
jgi:type II secretory pathway pseudopilin PulG